MTDTQFFVLLVAIWLHTALWGCLIMQRLTKRDEVIDRLETRLVQMHSQLRIVARTS
jgi:hypothetical protein